MQGKKYEEIKQARFAVHKLGCNILEKNVEPWGDHECNGSRQPGGERDGRICTGGPGTLMDGYLIDNAYNLLW